MARAPVHDPERLLRTLRDADPGAFAEPPAPGARFLALDVSSTATGWAEFDLGQLRPWPIDFGRILAPEGAGIPPWERVDYMADEVERLARERRPDFAVMEWSSGHAAHHVVKEGRSPAYLVVVGHAQGACSE